MAERPAEEAFESKRVPQQRSSAAARALQAHPTGRVRMQKSAKGKQGAGDPAQETKGGSTAPQPKKQKHDKPVIRLRTGSAGGQQAHATGGHQQAWNGKAGAGPGRGAHQAQLQQKKRKKDDAMKGAKWSDSDKARYVAVLQKHGRDPDRLAAAFPDRCVLKLLPAWCDHSAG